MKEKIALCTDFRPEERDLMLDAVNYFTEDRDMGEHTYPSKYPPGSDPWVTVAWEILDILRPGAIHKSARALLAGMLASELHTAFEIGAASAEAVKAIKQ